MMGAGTRYQKALGIEDHADLLFHDYMQLNQWKVESGVVRRLAERCGPTVEWLGDLGVEYYEQLVFGGDEPLPRVHCPIGRGQAVVDVLTRHCREPVSSSPSAAASTGCWSRTAWSSGLVSVTTRSPRTPW